MLTGWLAAAYGVATGAVPARSGERRLGREADGGLRTPDHSYPVPQPGRRIPSWSRAGKGPDLIDGALWTPYQPTWFPTPPFAEWVSGHSTFSAAGAEVLKRFTGSDYFGGSVVVPAGSSKVEPRRSPSRGVTLSWETFSAAADEAGISRRYGGIHFEEGDLAARNMGRLVGVKAFERATKYICGNATS